MCRLPRQKPTPTPEVTTLPAFLPIASLPLTKRGGLTLKISPQETFLVASQHDPTSFEKSIWNTFVSLDIPDVLNIYTLDLPTRLPMVSTLKWAKCHSACSCSSPLPTKSDQVQVKELGGEVQGKSTFSDLLFLSCFQTTRPLHCRLLQRCPFEPEFEDFYLFPGLLCDGGDIL